MMVSYTRARAEGLGIKLSGGLMQRAERIVLVTGGSLIAAWYGELSAVPILGSTMLICALASAATAINRWMVAYRLLSQRDGEPVVDAGKEIELPVAMPLPPRLASLSSPERRKVRPLEQH
jgi:hypothetical protein